VDKVESYITRIGGSIFIKLPYELLTDASFPDPLVMKLRQSEKTPIIIQTKGSKIQIRLMQGDDNGTKEAKD
jgi:hypothetical protein